MPGGYMGRLLRVDLTSGRICDQPVAAADYRFWLGGAGLGARFLYAEVAPGTPWDSPDNKVIIATGPLAGTRASGSGAIACVTVGAMTGGVASTQAQGFLGAFLKFQGYDGIILEGQAPDWVYLYVGAGGAELRDARPFLGVDAWHLRDRLCAHLGLKVPTTSVFGIGPAGEHRVRFAALVGDHGHVAAHGGVGAVLGAKRLKAVVVPRGSLAVPIHDPAAYGQATTRLREENNATPFGRGLGQWGTAGIIPGLHATGVLPVKNYTTNLFPEHERLSGEYMRTHMKMKPHPCWACGLQHHCELVEVTEGPYAGYQGEEPEYEGMAAFGSLLGITDPGAAIMLANECDKLGLNLNEAGWLAAWCMEAREQGHLRPADLDGLELTWGNAAAVLALLRKVAYREGCGAWLAEGTRRNAERVGGPARDLAVYTLKGNVPRTHDHRAAWWELLDTCVSNTSTIESTGRRAQPEQHGLTPITNPFDWEQVAAQNARLNGRRLLEDSLGLCGFTAYHVDLMVASLNAITGWDFTVAEAMTVGRRILHTFRVFNLRSGLGADLEFPSARYASSPADGPARGTSIMAHFAAMRARYYELMGWDPQTGVPRRETLAALGLAALADDLATSARP